MNAYTKIIIRQDFTKKDGTHPICLRVTVNRKPKYLNLNISAKPIFWDSKRLLVKKDCPNSYKINLIIQNAVQRAEKILFDYNIQNKPLSIGEFVRHFNTPGIKGNSFIEFVERTIKDMEKTFSTFTIKTYKSHLNKIKEYSPEVSFADLSLSFIKGYESFLIGKGNGENTRSKSMSILKSFINKAIKVDHVKENPFKHYPLSKKDGNRDFLTIEELKLLEDKYQEDLPRGLKNTLKYFLFACYTGLRYQDVKALQYDKIYNDMVVFKMHKTKDPIKIPLIEKSKSLIGSGLEKQKVFKVTENQVTNRNLKKIIKLTTIKKKISFHSARHTFATVGITLGIPLEVISKLLGHKDLQTTQIYAKIVDNVKIKEMEKWNQL